MKWSRANAFIGVLILAMTMISSAAQGAVTADEFRTIGELSEFVSQKDGHVESLEFYRAPTMINYRLQTYTEQETIIRSEFLPGDFDIKYVAFDLGSDGDLDYITTAWEPYRHVFSSSGEYDVKVYAVDEKGLIGMASVAVEVSPGYGEQVKLPYTKPLNYNGLKRKRTTAAQAGDSATYVLLHAQDNYYNGYFYSAKTAYEILRDEYGYPDSMIYFVCEGINDSVNMGWWDWEDTLLIDVMENEAIQLDSATNFLYERMGTDDDLIIIHLAHGNGSYDSTVIEYGDVLVRNCHPYSVPTTRWSVLDAGHPDIDFVEAEAPICFFWSRGDLHRAVGMYEWGAVCGTDGTLFREMLVGRHDTLIYHEADSIAISADDDIWLERISQICKGDLNHDGRIDETAGEVADWDDDGIPPVDTNIAGALVWDEDDWNTDTCWGVSEWQNHALMDSAFDSLADYTLNPYDSIPRVAGTDWDNDGIITGIDWNQDGDLLDSVGSLERSSLFSVDTVLTNFLDSLEYRTVQILMQNCFSGGYIANASRTGVAIATSAPEGNVGYGGLVGTGLVRDMIDAMGEADFEDADANNSGCVSFVESYNYGKTNHGARVRYDDNGDGVPAIGDVPTGGDGTLGQTLSWGMPHAPDWVFDSTATYVSGVLPFHVASADVNCDGNSDIIVSLLESDSVAVHAGNGMGGFGASPDFYVVGSGANQICVADLDGDEIVEIIASAYDSDSLTVLFGDSTGDYSTSRSDYYIGDGPYSVAAADFDGDGDIDVAVGNCLVDSLSILLGDGSGNLTVDGRYSVGDNPISVVAADLDNDDDIDLLSVARDDTTLTILWNGSDSTADFDSQSTLVVGSGPYSVTAVDLNGDDLLDIASVNFDSDDVSVLLNSGSQTFDAQDTYEHFWIDCPTSIVSSDYDLDGDVDLALASSASGFLGMLENDGAGSFVWNRHQLMATAVYDLVSIDVDDDGDMDLVGSAIYVDSLLVVYDAMDPAPPMVDSVYPGENLVDVSTGTNISVTFDRDVASDSFEPTSFVVYGLVSGYHGGSFSVSNPTVTFNPSTDFAVGEQVTVVVTEDVESSRGSKGVQPTTWSFVTETTNGVGAFDSTSSFSTAEGPYHVASADVDGDGNMDLIVTLNDEDSVSVYLGDGDGDVDTTLTYLTGSGPYDVAVGDLDGDGDMDLVVTNYDVDSISVHLGDGTGAFSSVNDQYYAADGPMAVSLADLNGDGYLDILSAACLDDRLGVFFGDGAGDFVFDAFYTFADGSPRDVVAGDFDNDGALDLATVLFYDSTVTILWNESNSLCAFDSTSTMSVGVSPTALTAVDFDDDGKLDIATLNYGSKDISVVLNTGNRSFASDVIYSIDSCSGLASIIASDLDADGDIDLAASDIQGGKIATLPSDGDGTFGTPRYYSVGSNMFGLTAFDFDDDGDVDLASVDCTGDDLYVLFNVPDTVPVAPTLVSPSNGRNYTFAPISINLDWNDVATATSYDVMYDLNTTTGLSSSGYTVSTPSSTTHYWKARAVNERGAGPWSSTWSFTIGWTPSCPVLFTYDGQGYNEENPLLTACEESIYTEDVVDYYHINSPVNAEDGLVKFQLREMEDEVTYLKDLELITVDHAADTRVAVSADGEIAAYSDIIAPLTAVDHNGIDRMAELAVEDGNMFSSLEPGHLIMTFPNHGTKGKFYGVASGPGGGCPKVSPDGDEPVAAIGKFNVKVEFLDQTGNWVEGSPIPARHSSVLEVSASTEDLIAGQDFISVRVSWDNSYSIDVVNQLISTDDQPTVRNWSTNDFGVTRAKAVDEAFAGFDGETPLVLEKGDVFEIAFRPDPVGQDGTVRDYIVVASGRYQPDYSVYSNLIPGSYHLYDAYPNPFNPSTTISYDLPQASDVKLEVYNITGQKVTTLIEEYQEAGHQQIEWNGLSSSGNAVSSGVYFYRITAGNFTDSKKMVLVK